MSVLGTRKRSYPAHATSAILASTLLPPQFQSNQSVAEGPVKVQTGWGAEIDEHVLNGGLRGIVSVAVHRDAGEGDVAAELLYTTTTNVLLSNPESCVFIIATPNHFFPQRLYQKLCQSISSSSTAKFSHRGYIYRRDVPEESDTLGNGAKHERGISGSDDEAKAKSAMERVHVMRVFDLEGCLEAIAEVRGRLREKDRQPRRDETAAHPLRAQEDSGGKDCPTLRKDGSSMEQVQDADQQGDRIGSRNRPTDRTIFTPHDTSREEQTHQNTLLPREIADSQSPSPVSESPPVSPPEDIDEPIASSNHPPPPPNPQTPSTNTSSEPGSVLLLLPNLPHLAAAQMRRNHVRGHALLVHLLRNIQHLCTAPTSASSRPPSSTSAPSKPRETTANPIPSTACLILNSTVGATAESNIDPAAAGGGASIFASNAGIRPALGKTFGYFVDMALLVTGFAEPLTGENQNNGRRRRVSVMEVMWDKRGDRGGQWGILF